MNLLRDQDRLSVLQLGLAHGPGAARCTAAQRLDRELQLVAWLKRLARPAVADQCARSGAFEAPELGAAVLLLDRQDDERVRTGELELLHHAFELDRILLVEHRERVMRQNGTARGDEDKAHHCSQLPSHGVPLLIAPWRACRSRGTTRTHAMRMSSLEPEESPGHKDAMPADGTFLAALATNGDTGTSPFHGSSWSVEPSDIILYQERGASEKIELVGRRAHIGARNRYRSSDGSRRLAYTGFLLS